MHIKREELKKFTRFNGPLIDVRSPCEYYKGHMPNSINIPLFDNEERAIVGKIYKKNGKEKAVIQGLKFVEIKIETLLNNIFECIHKHKYNNLENYERNSPIRIYCARGGMRSLSIGWLLEKFNFNIITLKGGYKSYRRKILECFSNNYNLVVIGGKTGTGKTKLLHLLEKYNYQTIDLEGFACHRGSTFGGLGMNEQPSNEQFENMIAEKLFTYYKNDHIFVEAESANIGRCKVPHELFNQMKSAQRIEIIRSQSNRLEELISTYSIFKKEELAESVLRIKKRLGPQRTKIAIESIKEQKWDIVCSSVLEYYDKCYEYEKIGKDNIKKIDLTDLEYDKNIIELINNIL